MMAQAKSLAFAPIADRLAKLIPRLASDQAGEVAATAAAIARTLAGAGLDWHDLAARLTGQTITDLVAKADACASPAPEPARPSWSAEKEAEFQAARNPRREPPPGPTWGRLSHFGRIGMLDAIEAEGRLTPEEAEKFAAFHAAYYRHQIVPGRKLIALFNAACRDLWERGWRPEEKAA